MTAKMSNPGLQDQMFTLSECVTLAMRHEYVAQGKYTVAASCAASSASATAHIRVQLHAACIQLGLNQGRAQLLELCFTSSR